GTAAVGAVAVAQILPFNALELIWTPRQWLWLALLYLLFAVPFFFAAACTAVALACFPAPVGRIYRFDLVGAGVGALAMVGVLSLLRPHHATALIGALGPLAATLVLARSHPRPAAGAALVALMLAGLSAAGWPPLRISPFKPLAQTLQVDGTAVVAEGVSPIGLVQVVESAWIPFRSVTGLSLMNRQEPAPQLGLFMDGDGPEPITRFTGDEAPLAYLDATLGALPYRLLDRPRVLLLGLGGGSDLLLALRHAARAVDVVEPDATVADLLGGELREFAGPLLDRPEVRLHVAAARRFVLAHAAEHDLILLHPHAGGRSTLAENFATTVEAFADYLARLSPEGLLVLPHPLRLPPRDSLKLVLTALAALERLGELEPHRHLALVRGWDGVLLLVRRTPFGADDLVTIEAFAEELAFDLGWHPAMARDAADRFNLLGEPVLFDGVAALAGPERAAFVAGYAFDIRPATDDRPYFLDFFRWRALPALWAAARQGNAGLLDWGWPLQLATLGVAVLFSLVLILLPARLLAGRSDGSLRRATGAYFLLIGAGFMFVEIATMQRLVLVLGQPVYAFAVTLAAFLVFAGIGSGMAPRLEPARPDAARRPNAAPRPEWLRRVVLLIAGLASLHALAGPWLVAASAHLGGPARLLLALALLAPLAAAMGLPFPLVLARLKAGAPALVPWAWGVNGCASVIAAVLAGLILMSLGSRSLMLLGVLAYLLAALAERRIRQPAEHRADFPTARPVV
ncbi:MAG TPA: hypothetical protein VFG43_09465, partial [Geminicoccaceae bacterium]|nr:hypothetical protein [Geminicoccaceae bacterium]